MNEGLTIKLAVQGVQDAVSSLDSIKDKVAALGDQISAIAKVSIVAGIARDALGLSKELLNVQASVDSFSKEWFRLQDQFKGDGPIGVVKALRDALYNSTNASDAAAQRSLDKTKEQLQLIEDSARQEAYINSSRIEFAQKKLSVEEMITEVQHRNRMIAENSEKIFAQRIQGIEGKIKSVSPYDSDAQTKRITLQTELEVVKNERILAGIKRVQDVQSVEAEKMSLIRSMELSELTEKLAIEERLIKIKQDQFNVAQVQVQSSYLLTEVEKRKQLLELYQRERDAIRDQIALMEQRRNGLPENDTQGREVIQSRIDSAQRRGLGVDQQIAGVQSQADPNSVIQNMQAAITELQNTAGTIAQGIASSFKNAFESAISSVSNGITGLIMGTQTWGQALAQIGNQVLTSLVSSFVQMGVRLIATQILVHTAGKALALAGVAAMSPIAAASAAVWAPAATMATIATFGGAAAAAPGLMSAATVSAIGQSVMASFAGAGFERGGYTGDGPRSSPAGIVHRGEYVIPAPVVDRIGVQSLDRLSAGGGGGQNIAFFDDGTKLSDWAKTQEGETIIVDVVRRNMHRL